MSETPQERQEPQEPREPHEHRPSVELADPVVPPDGLTPEELQHEVEAEMRDEDA